MSAIAFRNQAVPHQIWNRYTGATQTGLPIDFLTDIGCPTTNKTPHRTITTGNGVIQVPMAKPPGTGIVQVPWLNCLGQRVENFPVLALQLPVSRYINGILGMDFLTQFQAVIDTGKGFITLP